MDTMIDIHGVSPWLNLPLTPLKFQADWRAAAAVLHVMRWGEKMGASKAENDGAESEKKPHPSSNSLCCSTCWVVGVMFLVLRGALMSRSLCYYQRGRSWKTDSNMQHDDGSQIQGLYWLTARGAGQLKPRTRQTLLADFILSDILRYIFVLDIIWMIFFFWKHILMCHFLTL